MAEFPMHRAVLLGDLETLRELIDLGWYVDSRNIWGETPLTVAARNGHREPFDLLVQYGAQINCGLLDNAGYTPLHWASWYGWVDQVRHILEKGGADLNEISKDGDTPLIVAARRSHREIFDLLMQYGAQVNYGRDYHYWTPLHWASREGWVDQVQRILEKGGEDLNVAVNDGDTPLILAARCGHKDIFDLLLQYGAQVNCGRDDDDWTPLHWASYKGWVDQVRHILEKGGADLYVATNRWDSPIIVAARHGHKDIFVLLFQYGATKEGDFARISQHSFFKDVDLCTQLIVNKFYCQSLSALYRYPDIAKKLPLLKNFKLKDQQTQQIANFVESEIQTKTFCNVFKAQPIVLVVLCTNVIVRTIITQSSVN